MVFSPKLTKILDTDKIAPVPPKPGTERQVFRRPRRRLDQDAKELFELADRTGKRVTLGDVAKATGYTINTVSHALRDMDDISLETRVRIQETAERMGYVRNVMASSLRSGRTRTLGLILGALENPYYAIMANELSLAAEKKGYTVVVLSSRDDPGRELRMTNTAIGHQMDGILIFPSMDPRPAVSRMQEAGLPFVVLARELGYLKADTVRGDDAQGACLAARHLIEAGRRHLGYYSQQEVSFSSSQRLEGFRRACREAGIPDADQRISCMENRPRAEILTEWIRDGVDGLCAFCDAEAWQAVSLLTERGFRIPQDLAVIGFDNIQDSLVFPWPICSVGFDMTQFAESAIRLIRHKIHHPDSEPQEVILPCSLTCRHSCGV